MFTCLPGSLLLDSICRHRVQHEASVPNVVVYSLSLHHQSWRTIQTLSSGTTQKLLSYSLWLLLKFWILRTCVSSQRLKIAPADISATASGWVIAAKGSYFHHKAVCAVISTITASLCSSTSEPSTSQGLTFCKDGWLKFLVRLDVCWIASFLILWGFPRSCFRPSCFLVAKGQWQSGFWSSSCVRSSTGRRGHLRYWQLL